MRFPAFPSLFPVPAIAAALVLLAGCASVPRDTALQPREVGSIASTRSLAGQPGSAWPVDRWWTAFGDPALSALIEEGLTGSPDVAAAAARLRKASALAQQAGAASLPRLDVEGSATMRKESYNMGFPKEFLPQGWNDYGYLAGVAGLDLDVWGRNRAALAAATSQQRAAAVDLAQAQLMLAGAIAVAYADLQRLHEAKSIAEAAMAMRAATGQLIADRARGGLEAQSGVRLAQAQTATARAELAEIEQDLALRRNQIAALVGAGPDRGVEIAAPALTSPLGLGLPEGVTTDLIGRRPDIVAARERVSAAASRVRVARADFFPAIRLDALLGLQSLGLDSLFRSGSDFGNAGPAFSLPLFRGGDLRGRFRGAGADYDLAVADYDRTVIEAYREAADAVTVRRSMAGRLTEARTARDASEGAYGLAQLRYRAGLSTYLDVLAVEDRVLAARRLTNALEAAAREADIALIRALGGGFAPAPDHMPEDSSR